MHGATLSPYQRLGGFSGGLYIRLHGPCAKGSVYPSHRHYIDHATFFFSGSATVHITYEDGTEEELHVVAPNAIEVKAGSMHTITSLEDGSSWCCVFSEALAEKIGLTRYQAGDSIPYEDKDYK